MVELGGIIPAYLIDRSDNGKHIFENVVFNTPGVHYIYVEDPASGKRYVSNPIKVSEKPSLNIYWGDIHSHSNFSDGAGFPSEQFDLIIPGALPLRAVPNPTVQIRSANIIR